jgi:hypothetical protein
MLSTSLFDSFTLFVCSNTNNELVYIPEADHLDTLFSTDKGFNMTLFGCDRGYI